jgi:putative transposase
VACGERGIWQRRYWEHLIRDDADYRAHMDYVHINPLKHGLVRRVGDWPHSTFHRLVMKIRSNTKIDMRRNALRLLTPYVCQ